MLIEFAAAPLRVHALAPARALRQQHYMLLAVDAAVFGTAWIGQDELALYESSR